MFYVEPNSEIRLLHDVPIDKDYINTLWFQDATAQYNYFVSKTVSNFQHYSYVRKTRGAVKVQIAIQYIYECNYMMYKNINFENKWFYAFITGIEYVNNVTSIIYFEIDQLQTWLFDMRLNQCFIDRCHSTTDDPGDNLIPEGLETGEYMYVDNDYDWCHMFTSYDVVVYTTFASAVNPGGGWTFTRQSGDYRWGIYTGLNIRVFRSIEDANTVTSINSFISAAVAEFGDETGIVAMIMIPHEALDANNLPTQILHTVPRITTVGSYTPKNKKLLTSPYVFVEMQNCEGAVASLPQEYFTGTSLNPNALSFMITFNITTAPVAFCVPINYKGSEYNYPEGEYINNFSQCSYNTDLFKAYMAQSLTAKIGQNAIDSINNLTPIKKFVEDLKGWNGSLIDIADKMTSGVQTGIANLFSGNIPSLENMIRNPDIASTGGKALGGILAGSVASGNAEGILQSVYNNMQTMYAKSVAAPHNNGANTPDYLTSNRLKGFWFFHRVIRPEFARKIDEYFDRFGYKQNAVGTPNIHARQYWTYVKTVGASVSGYIPAEATVAIQNIFNAGITFWTDPANVGNYSLTNSIL